MDYAIGIIMNIFNMKIEEVTKLGIDQYKTYLRHAMNVMVGYRQGEMDFSYKETKDNTLRNRLEQLKKEAEARKGIK